MVVNNKLIANVKLNQAPWGSCCSLSWRGGKFTLICWTSLVPSIMHLTLLRHPSVSSRTHKHSHKDILLSCSYSLEERLKKHTHKQEGTRAQAQTELGTHGSILCHNWLTCSVHIFPVYFQSESLSLKWTWQLHSSWFWVHRDWTRSS